MDLLMKYIIVGSIFGMLLFSIITIVLPLVITAHNKISRNNTE